MIAPSSNASPEAAQYMREVEAELERLAPVPKPIRSSEVIAAVCAESGVTVSEIFGERRYKSIMVAKRACTVCIRDLCRRSSPEIARDMQDPNHSTHIGRYYRPRDPETVALIARVKSRVAAERNINSEGGR